MEIKLKELQELNNRYNSDKDIVWEYDGIQLKVLDGENIGIDLMLKEDGFELDINKKIGTYKDNCFIWELITIEDIDISKFRTEDELNWYIRDRLNDFEKEYK